MSSRDGYVVPPPHQLLIGAMARSLLHTLNGMREAVPPLLELLIDVGQNLFLQRVSGFPIEFLVQVNRALLDDIMDVSRISPAVRTEAEFLAEMERIMHEQGPGSERDSEDSE